MTRLARAFGVAFLLLAIAPSANSQAKYDPGVNDSEIKLGQTAPYSCLLYTSPSPRDS